MIDIFLEKNPPTCERQDQSSLRGSIFAAPGGNEKVLVFELKHANISDILRNFGFNLTGKYTKDTSLEWKDDSCLSSGQQAVKDLALHMCLNGQQGVMLDRGVLAFVCLAISRDVPEMVKQLHEQCDPVHKGSMLVSEHLQKLVWAVLNPCDFSQVKVISDEILPKNVAFPKEKNGSVMLLPGAPGGQFREQGLVSAKAAKAPNAQTESIHLDVETHADSMESHPIRSTGDLPSQASIHRANICDRPGRQPLKASPPQ